MYFSFIEPSAIIDFSRQLQKSISCPTVCVTRVWAGVDKVCDVEKTQSQKKAKA
jgi:hypothetical protein